MQPFDMELTQRQARQYLQAGKKRRGQIITDYCELTGVSRNLASKRFRATVANFKPQVLKTNKPKKKPGRKPKYIAFHLGIIRKTWELSGEVCAERLHPMIGVYIKQLQLEGQLKYFGKRYINKTQGISEASLRRAISGFPKAGKSRKNRGHADIYKAIPIQAYFGNNANKSGYFEIDYVEHNGGNSLDTFANTGTYVDVGLGWVARAAALGKHQSAVQKIHETNETKILHRVYEYHPDNAKPILKLLLEKTLGTKPPGYSLSRSRPYHKEDNGHVEQKNDDKVRKLVGYHRYDTSKQVALLNQLYQVEDLIGNYFQASQKLIKKVTGDRGRVIKRKYDRAKTPYRRLMAATDIGEPTKNKVTAIYRQLNLVRLREQADQLQQQLLQTIF